jgi:glucan phosphoethanolaminetransferase (alkaline phosphatase superfamily)
MKKLLFNKHNLVFLSIIIYFSFLNVLFTKEILEVNSSFAYRFFVCTTNIGFSLIFTAFISINRWLLISLLIPMLFIGGLLSYFKLYLGINFNEALIESTLNTHSDEILSVINFRLIGWIILFWAIPIIFLIKNLHHLKIQFLQKIKINIICGLLGTAIFTLQRFSCKKSIQ